MKKIKNILAFFGAFNPPTVAHIELARFACESVGADGVMFVPSKSEYIKNEQGKDYAYSDEIRLKMLSEAAKSRHWMLFTDCEMKMASQPRTYHTLLHIRSLGYSPRLMLGSDKLPELEGVWAYVLEMATEFGIVCLARGGDNCEEIIKSSPFLSGIAEHITVVRTPDDMQNVSSTTVRSLVAKGDYKAAQALVPPEIFPIIADKDFSRKECNI